MKEYSFALSVIFVIKMAVGLSCVAGAAHGIFNPTTAKMVKPEAPVAVLKIIKD